jgi:endogenous inhibitor of DNA gyrase (YacG/DUF329 family)
MAAVKCPICDKAVYKMEEIVALGRTWHKVRLRCSLGCKTHCSN